MAKIICVAFCLLAGFVVCQVWADNPQQGDKAVVVTATNSCCGKYYAYARMTNSAGLGWIIPPTNIVVHSGTLTDLSGFPPPYSSSAAVLQFGLPTYMCASNSVTFPATNNIRYQLSVYVTSSASLPTNGQPMNLQIQWNTNTAGN